MQSLVAISNYNISRIIYNIRILNVSGVCDDYFVYHLCKARCSTSVEMVTGSLLCVVRKFKLRRFSERELLLFKLEMKLYVWI